MTNLVEALLALNSHLSHKSLIVLQNLNGEFLWAAIAVHAEPLAHSELEASEAVSRCGVLHSGCPSEVRRLRRLTLQLSCAELLRGLLRPSLRLRPSEAKLDSGQVSEGLFDDE